MKFVRSWADEVKFVRSWADEVKFVRSWTDEVANTPAAFARFTAFLVQHQRGCIFDNKSTGGGSK